MTVRNCTEKRILLEAVVGCSVKQRAEDEWMLDPVIIADTYGASGGREVLNDML